MHLPSWLRPTVVLGPVLLTLAAARPAPAEPLAVNVTTYHNDAARTGQYLHETLLTPATVSAGSFGKQFATAVDGQVYAQPLYLAGLALPGHGRHNVVFAATEHDSVYALDAETGEVLWQTSFLTAAAPDTAVSTVSNTTDLPSACGQIAPELGITATPALDAATGRLYVVAMTKETTTSASGAATVNFFQRLHALDVTTGAEVAGSPVEIQATYPGTGDGGTEDVFVPLNYKARPGLVLSRGVVYTFWSSHCDAGDYHGWVIGYDAATLAQRSVYVVDPNGSKASLWNGGAAPAVDAAGNLYLDAGNGTFDAQNDDGSPNPGGVDFGESLLRVTPAGKTLTTADWFTPFNVANLDEHDLDTGSSGVVLYDVGDNHLLASAGKEGRIYVLNRDNLGKFTPNADTGAVQTVLPGAAGLAGGLFGCPAFFNSSANGPTLYFAAVGDYAKAFVLDSAGELPAAPTSHAASTFAYPGSVPSISANGGTGGIAWMLEASGVLHAYDADNLATELYNSNQNASRDALGSYVKFSTPVITQGKVYVGTADHLVAYGLIRPTRAADLTSQFNVAVGEAQPSANGNYLEQGVTLTSNGAVPAGPVLLVLDDLNPAASLHNADGTTTQLFPRGCFYKTVTLRPDGNGTVRLIFKNASNSRIAWTPRVLGATGAH